MKKRPKVVLIQSALPDYRQRVLEHLLQSEAATYRFMAGDNQFEPSVRTGVVLGNHLRMIRNHYLLGRRLLWQRGVHREAFDADSAILEFNPRILSVWTSALMRKLLRKRTVFWGHAWPRRDRRTVWARDLLARLGDGVVCYTQADARDIRRRLPSVRVFVAPNATATQADMRPAPVQQTPTDFIYVGRFSPEKKPDLLIRAFNEAAPSLGDGSRLWMVGDGPLRVELEELVSELRPPRPIEFTGWVSDWERLRDLYSSCIASISPGFAGLSVTQSHSFGVPILIARDEPHAPEIEAAREGVNALFFPSDQCSSLASLLMKMSSEASTWLERREGISADCRTNYSVEAMAAGLEAGALGKP